MTNENVNLRIVQARRVLAGWQALGRPAGNLEDLLRMIGDEIATLERIIGDHPAKAASVGDLVTGYRDLASRLRSMAN